MCGIGVGIAIWESGFSVWGLFYRLDYGSQRPQVKTYIKVPYLDGVYEICLNNNVDMVSSKTVAFQLSTPIAGMFSYNETNLPADVLLLQISYCR